MGIYAVTGGSSGIGAKTIEHLQEAGHTTINIDINKGDICGNLATPEGRKDVLTKLYGIAPDGLDGLICNAGVSASCGDLKLIISLNYYGARDLAVGCFELLKKKKGYCVVTSSNTISQSAAARRMDIVGLLNNQQDEHRVLRLVEGMDVAANAHAMYVASKYALARWMRRVSALWAANGVHINAVAPGNVATAMTANLSPEMMQAALALPIPTLYGEECLMDADDIARAMVFLSSPLAHGINGVILFCDGGTDALLNSEKVY